MSRDWEDDWVFYDNRFNLPHAPDEKLLRFLYETAHPVAGPNVDDARMLIATYNKELAADSWSLIVTREISGRPVFVPQKLGQRAQVFQDPTGWQKVDRQLQEVRLRLETTES